MTFTISGPIKGKGRPRFSKVGNYVKTYTPEDTLSYENLVAYEYKVQGGTYTEKALKVYINVFCEIPKSTSKKNRALMLSGGIRPSKKPDCDNIAKIICDALNKVAYKDDSQIVELTVTKDYTDGAPLVKVYLKEV